jgi:lipoprotein NlpI
MRKNRNFFHLILLLPISVIITSCGTNKTNVDRSKIDRDSSKIYYQRAIKRDSAHRNVGIFELSKAIRFDPKESANYNLRGIFFEENGKYSEAKKDFDFSISLDSTNSRTYSLRGELLLKMKDTMRACDNFVKSYRLGETGDLKFYRKVCKCHPEVKIFKDRGDK